jgi:H+/gluconate symporter-like permease
MFSVIAIFITLALVMFLAFKRLNIVIVAIIAAIALAILNGQNIISMLTDTFMPGAASYVQKFFLLFCISALFGKIMEQTGAAAAIAKCLADLLGKRFAILGVILAGAILCYGGISALVIAFTMYPIALSLFQRADLPRRLIPGAIAAGCFTFAAAAFPGTPQTINIIPTSYLGTTVSAAPLLGIICGIIGMFLTCVYMYWAAAKARKNGEHFIADEKVLQELAAGNNPDNQVNPVLAFIPIIVIIVLLVGLKQNVLLSMLIGTVLCGALFYKKVHAIPKSLGDAVMSGTTAAIFTGCIVGYGAVVSSSAGYAVLSNALMSLKASPLLSFGLATTILAGCAGSGTGGLAITMNSMAQQYIAMGIDPEVLHRIGTLSAIGLDSLPHNGAVIVLLTLCGMTHKDSYLPIFITTVVITCIVMFIAIGLGTVMYPIG